LGLEETEDPLYNALRLECHSTLKEPPLSRTDKVTIKIPRPLYDRLKAIIHGSGFDSVTDFVVYVLRDLAASKEESSRPSASLTPEEIEAIKRRLKALGYL
jgi:hypothetical protein